MPSDLPTASVIALLRFISGQIGGSSLVALITQTEMPEFSYVNSTIVFAISVLNRTTQTVIPSGDLTAGTIDVIRIRAGVETTIHSGVALNKKDGLLYYNIDLTDVDWALDDVVKVVQNTKSVATIAGSPYDIPLIPQACMLTDLGDISTQIDNIETIVTETNVYLEPGGLINDLLVNIQADIGNLQNTADNILIGVDAIHLVTDDINQGLADKESPEIIWATVDMPATDIGFSVLELLHGLPIVSGSAAVNIDRYRKGTDPGWVNISSPGAGFNPLGGRFSTPYTFPQANWAVGDICRVGFTSVTVRTVGGPFPKDIVLPDQYVYFIIGLPDILQDLDDGGRIDLILDGIETDIATIIAALNTIETKVDNIQADVTTIDGKIDAMQLDVTDILADTNELQTDWTDGGRLDLILDSILEDTNELQTDWTDGGRLDLILDNVDSNVVDIQNTLAAQAIVQESISEKVDAQLSLGEFNRKFTPTDASDHTLYQNGNDKIKKPLIVKVDVDNMDVGDTITITEYTKLEKGGVWIQVDKEAYSGVDGGLVDSKVIYWNLEPDRFGTKLILNQTAGVYRQFTSEAIAEE